MQSDREPGDAATTGPSRLVFIDVFRGLIMAHMALDHVAWSFFDGYVTLELGWRAPVPFGGFWAFLTRFSGAFVAPAFAFLAGYMVATTSRRRAGRGVSEASVTRRLLLRALILVAVGIPLSFSTQGIVISVLVCLGLSLALLTALRRVPPAILAVGTLILFAVLPAVSRDLFPTWLGIVLNDARPTFEGGLMIFNPYPVLPWVGFMVAGFVTAATLGGEGRRRKWLILAGIFLLLFFVLRLAGGYGNAYRHDGILSLPFWFLAKYPPDLVFVCWAFANIFGFLALFELLVNTKAMRYLQPLVEVGRVALFFYVMHLFVIGVFDHAGLPRYPIAAGWAIWFTLMVTLYYPCLWYWQAKVRWPNLVIRYF